MKTKVLLSILLLIASILNLHAQNEEPIPIEKIRYATDHPGIPVLVNSDTIIQSTGIFTSSFIEINKMIVYENNTLSKPFYYIKKIDDRIDGGTIGIIIIIAIFAYLFGREIGFVKICKG